MTIRPDPVGPILDATVQVARAAFPKGTQYLQMCDALRPIFADADFAPLYPARGRPAEAP